MQVIIEPIDSIWLDTVREPIYLAIRSLIAELEDEMVLQSFHFFHEYGNVELRIRTEYRLGELAIQAHLSGNNAIKEFTICDYEPELDQYGIDGWPIVQMFFEACSRYVLVKWNEQDNLGHEFRVKKLVHCFLNQVFAERTAEVQFYADGLRDQLAIGWTLTAAWDGQQQARLENYWLNRKVNEQESTESTSKTGD
jgi:hypothetical protein